MKFVFKGFLPGILKSVFLAIPVSLVVAGLIWFFWHLLLGKELEFLETWKTLYLAIFIFDVAISTLSVLGRLGFGIIGSRLYQASFNDVLEAFVEYKLSKQLDWKDWTPEKFRTFLSISRTSRALAHAVVEGLLGVDMANEK